MPRYAVGRQTFSRAPAVCRSLRASLRAAEFTLLTTVFRGRSAHTLLPIIGVSEEFNFLHRGHYPNTFSSPACSLQLNFVQTTCCDYNGVSIMHCPITAHCWRFSSDVIPAAGAQ